MMVSSESEMSRSESRSLSRWSVGCRASVNSGFVFFVLFVLFYNKNQDAQQSVFQELLHKGILQAVYSADIRLT